MQIKEQKEIEQLIADSSRILIATRGNPGFDDCAAALAWYGGLKEMKKERVDIAIHIPQDSRQRFSFLPGFENVKHELRGSDNFVVQIDMSKTKVKELSYDIKGKKLEIQIKPEQGNFTPKDVSFGESSYSYDLIIVIGASELISLGPIFDNNRELFFNTPVINIDRQSSNVRFGQINAVYLTVTSLSELSYSFLQKYVNKPIATNLLTGLISATNSFQTPQVTPETLRLASDLIVAGASREDIVDHLYRTKDIEKLKLWGRVLSNLQHVDSRIVYSHLSNTEVGKYDIDLQGLVDELVLASPEAHVVLFFYQQNGNKTKVFGYGRENYDLMQMFQKYNPKGRRRQITFVLNKDTAQSELEILDHIQKQFKLIQH